MAHTEVTEVFNGLYIKKTHQEADHLVLEKLL
jgi:hypothetical protein